MRVCVRFRSRLPARASVRACMYIFVIHVCEYQWINECTYIRLHACANACAHMHACASMHVSMLMFIPSGV